MKPSSVLRLPKHRAPYIAPQDFILRTEFQQADDSASESDRILSLLPTADIARKARTQGISGVGPVRPDWIKFNG